MVVFTCGHCGESVNKPKVEKHYMTKCRNRNPNLSCMDCFKDFFGNDYEEHTKCVTEEQRYAAKGFVAKEKKGEQKQSAWVEMVQSVLDEQKDAPANVLRILNTVSKHNNTPRKKPKFINFVKNVCGHKTNPKDIDAAWDMISVKLAALSINQNKNQKQDEEPKNETKTNDESISNTEEAEVSSTSDMKETNGDAEHNSSPKVKEGKKSKKQRKEEKKLKKYEAELESAGQVQTEDVEEEEQKTKKGKKKNKGESNTDINGAEESKNKKRKRQDTVNSTASAEATENDIAELPMQNLQLNVEKSKKKKPKVEPELEESICLHDQNVAHAEDQERTDKFNWHAVIMSVLQKKGNEVQFKRLQKKVLGEYAEVTGRDVDDRIADKFIKKLRSTPNVRVDKNRVVLVQ